METILVSVIVLLLGIAIFGAYTAVQRRYSPEAYSAWCKLYHRNDFTYEEWKCMRKSGLLDVPRDGGATVIIPVQSGR